MVFNFLKVFLVKVVQLFILSTVLKINENSLYNKCYSSSKIYRQNLTFVSFDYLNNLRNVYRCKAL